MSKWEYSETELWRFGEGDISIYHVFSTAAIGKTVLVFAEARHGDGSDSDCPHDIVMRKSTDGGLTFSETLCVLSSKDGSCWINPSPVFDEETGRLFLFYVENIGNMHTHSFVIHSDDFGDSWSESTEITELFETTFNLSGPGHGIQIKQGEHKGRLLMQFWHRLKGIEIPVMEREYCVSLLYSDDHGESWHHSKYFGVELLANESRIVETQKGLLWNARTKEKIQCVSRSRDGGNTWSEFAVCSLPRAKSCDVGAVSVWDKEGFDDMVLMSRISDYDQRRNMRIEISYDGGESFTDGLDLMRGDAMPGYSDLCVIDNGEQAVGLVHCRSNHVLFSRISLQTLTGGKYENTSRSVWLK